MASVRTFKPVSFAETISRYRTVNTSEAMGRALLAHCDQADPDFKRAAKSCIGFSEGKVEAAKARADFIKALTSAGIDVRGDG